MQKVINVCFDLNTVANRDTTFTLNLPLPASMVKVKQIVYNTLEAANIRVYQIFSNLTNDQFLGAFPAATCHLTPDLLYKVNNVQNGIFTFKVCEISDGINKGIPTTNALGQIILVLEFS